MGGIFPIASYRDIARVAKKLGFVLYRQAKGSHEIWRREHDGIQTTIPNHGSKDLKRKTIKAIIIDFDITIEEFQKLRKGK